MNIDQFEAESITYHWADGTWCYKEDLEEYLTFMSDDYEVQHNSPREVLEDPKPS